MKIIVSVTSLCLIFLIVSLPVLSTVRPRASARSSYTIGPDDKISVYMNELFDLSSSSNPFFRIESTKARLVNFTTPFTSFSLASYDILTIHQVADLGNGIVGILFNGKSALFIPFSKDGKKFGSPVLFTDPNIGTSVICDDIVLNALRARVYISCHQTGASKQEPGSSSVYEVDYTTGKLIQKIVVDQSDGYFVESVSKLRIVELTQKTGKMRFLVFYSQALSGGLGLQSNFFFRYFTGLDSGNLIFNQANLIDFKNTNLDYRIFYDIFQSGDSLIFTGLPSSGYETVSLRSCSFDGVANELLCSQAIQSTSVKKGWVGVLNDNKYVEVDLATTNHSAICNINGKFDGVNWLSNCYYNDSIAIFQDGFVSDVSLDNSAILIEFAHPDGGYMGYSAHLLYNSINSLHQDLVGALSEDRLISIDPNNNNQINLLWLVPDFAWIESADLQIGQNQIKISAFDDQTLGGVQSSITIIKQGSYIGDITVSSTFQWPELDVLQGSYYNWPVYGLDFTGNALSYDMQFDTKTAGLMELHMYHTSKIDVSIISDDPYVQDLRTVVVGSGYVIGKDSKNRLNFASCTYPGIAHVVCTLKAQIQLTASANLYSKTSSVNGNSFVWVSDTASSSTTFYLFNGHDVGSYVLKGVFVTDADAFLGKEDTREVGFLAYGRNEQNGVQQVEILKFEITNVHSLENYAILTKDNTQDGYLCPTKVNGNNFGFLAITTVCPSAVFSDTRVVVFRFPGPVPIIEVPLANDGSLTNAQACYFPESLLISGWNPQNNKPVMYITNPFIEDPSEEHFGLDEYGLSADVQVNCAEEQLLFSVVSTNQDGTKNIGVFYAYSRGNAGKRAHSLLKNQKVSAVSGFSTSHGMTHVTYDASGFPFFWTSFAMGPIFYTDVSTTVKNGLLKDTTQSGKVTVIATNANGVTLQSSSDFTLRSADTTISLSADANQELPNGTFDLEKYITINGSVFEASLSGGTGLKLKERISAFSKFERSGGQVYDFISQSGSRTYAVDVDDGYSEVDYFDDGRFIRTIFGLGFGHFTAFTTVLVDEKNQIDLMALSLKEGGTPQIFLYIYQGGNRKSVKVSTGRGDAQHLQLIYLGSNIAYLFAHTSRGVEFFVVTIASDLSSLTVQLTHIFTDFARFSAVQTNSNVYVLGFGLEGNSIIAHSISTSDPTQISDQTTIQTGHKYRLTTITCRPADLVSVVCVTNTLSSFISEIYITGQLQVSSYYLHDKYGYFEGYEVDICGNYIFMFGKTSKPGVVAMAILSWKTGKKGGNGKIYYGLQLPVPANQKVDIHYQAPFALVPNNEPGSNPGDAWLVAGFLNSNTPVAYFEVSSFKLTVADQNSDLSSINLNLQGLSTLTYNIGDVFKNSSNVPKTATKWWPFVLILAALIVLAVGWIVYNRIKSEKQNGNTEEANYGTVNSDKLLKDSVEGQAKEQL